MSQFETELLKMLHDIANLTGKSNIFDFNTLVTGILSLLSAIIGGVIGAYASKKATDKSIKAQEIQNESNTKLININRKQLEKDCAGIILIDFTSALANGFYVIKMSRGDNKNYSQLGLSFTSDYSKVINSLASTINYQDKVYLNKFYGILEKIKFEIMHCGNPLTESHNVINSYIALYKELFTENYEESLKLGSSGGDDIRNKLTDLLEKSYNTVIKKIFVEVGRKIN